MILTIKGGYRHAKKSCKVLMMMKAAKLGWAEQGRVGVDHEQTNSRVGAD